MAEEPVASLQQAAHLADQSDQYLLLALTDGVDALNFGLKTSSLARRFLA